MSTVRICSIFFFFLQPMISVSRRTVPPTSWRSCCGLFDVLRHSDRWFQGTKFLKNDLVFFCMLLATLLHHPGQDSRTSICKIVVFLSLSRPFESSSLFGRAIIREGLGHSFRLIKNCGIQFIMLWFNMMSIREVIRDDGFWLCKVLTYLMRLIKFDNTTKKRVHTHLCKEDYTRAVSSTVD